MYLNANRIRLSAAGGKTVNQPVPSGLIYALLICDLVLTHVFPVAASARHCMTCVWPTLYDLRLRLPDTVWPACLSAVGAGQLRRVNSSLHGQTPLSASLLAQGDASGQWLASHLGPIGLLPSSAAEETPPNSGSAGVWQSVAGGGCGSLVARGECRSLAEGGRRGSVGIRRLRLLSGGSDIIIGVWWPGGVSGSGRRGAGRVWVRRPEGWGGANCGEVPPVSAGGASPDAGSAIYRLLRRGDPLWWRLCCSSAVRMGPRLPASRVTGSVHLFSARRQSFSPLEAGLVGAYCQYLTGALGKVVVSSHLPWTISFKNRTFRRNRAARPSFSAAFGVALQLPGRRWHVPFLKPISRDRPAGELCPLYSAMLLTLCGPHSVVTARLRHLCCFSLELGNCCENVGMRTLRC